MRAAHFFLWASLVVSACGTNGSPTGDDGDDGSGSAEVPLLPAPPEGGQQLATTTITLQPGDEKYWCYTFYSPDDSVGITHITTISKEGVHHMGLFQAFGRDETPATPHECNVLIRETWMPVFASGAGSPTLDLPAGAGFVIEPGTQYIVQLHLQNNSDAPLDVRAGINLTYDHNPAALTKAGIYAFGTQGLSIPPNTDDFPVHVSNCTVNKPMDFFAVFPHMHKHATSLQMQYTPMGGAQSMLYQIDPWQFGDQPLAPITKHISAGDRFDMTCNYNNHGATPVTYGESSDDEMCYFVAFYTPYDGLDGCIQNGQ
ncbi:hypothetical protein BH11MYX2_BH11MYX2_24310 [soil metagenome]